MELNSKMICILEMLFAADGQITIGSAMDSLNISRRTLSYNLDKLNDFLKSIKVSTVEVSEGKLLFDISRKDEVRRAVLRESELCYVMSKEERRALMTISFAMQPSQTTIDSLAAMLEVSRNTVVTEIADLKEYLSEIGITLVNHAKRGYRLDGDEATVRYYIMECFYSIESVRLMGLSKQILYDAIQQISGSRFEVGQVDRLKKIVEYSEKYTDAHFNNNSLDEVVQYLLVIMVRASYGYKATPDPSLMDTREYAAAGIIVTEMSGLGLALPQQERIYITTVLFASKVYDADALKAEGPMHIREFAEDLVNTFSAKACVRFENYDELIERLLLHVRPMFYRLKYHIKVKNVLTREIKIKYRELYNLTDLAVKTIQQKYKVTVPDEEIAYLCAYIGGWMNRQSLPNSSGGMPRILIVCGAGIGTSLLLKQQISTLLGCGYLYETKDERETGQSDLSSYQLIVTAIDLSYAGGNIIRVSPILTTAQQNKLLAWSVERNDRTENYKVGDILEIIRSCSKINNEPQLINSLLEYLTLGKKPEPMEQMGMKELLTTNHIKIVDEAIDADRAVCLSCQPLIADGIIKESYAQSILDIVDSLGLYAEIASGILLAHGKPGEEARGVGITITLLKHPVVFQKWDKKIHVIVTLATKDNRSHLHLLRDIMKILSNPKTCSRLTECDFDTEQQVYEFIREELGAVES